MTDTDVAVIGAGPHGLAATAHLRRAGVAVHVLGEPMSFWRGMPAGMLLRSNWTATSIAEHVGPLSLDSFCADRGLSFGLPVPLESARPRFRLLTRGAQRPADDEVARNPRAASARLRAAERIRDAA